MKVNSSKLLSILSIIVLSAMVIFSLNQAAILICSFLIVLMFSGSAIDDEIAVLFFSVNLIAALNASVFGVPLGSILELMLIIKCFSKKTFRLHAGQFITLIALFVVAFASSLVLNYSAIRCIVYIVNIVLLLSLFEYTKSIPEQDRIVSLNKYYLSFVIGLSLTLIVSLLRTDISQITYYRRFTGLWTDPNYIGLFSAIGISMLIILAGKNVSRYIIFSPVIVLFLFSGYLTYSRSFVVAIFVIAFFMMIALFRSRRLHTVVKVFGALAVVAFAYIAYTQYLSGIISARGILDYTGRDLTNGRIDDWRRAWNVYTSSTINLIFGIGTSTSHNTFFDLLLKYGPLGGILGLSLIVQQISELRKYRLSNDVKFQPIFRIIYIVLLVYILTLPMLEDDSMYMLLGCFPLCYGNSSYGNQKIEAE